MNCDMISSQFCIHRVPIGQTYCDLTVPPPQPVRKHIQQGVQRNSATPSQSKPKSHFDQPLLTAMKKCNLDEEDTEPELCQVRMHKGIEEELYCRGKTVVWGRFSPLADSFPMAATMDTPVIAATWATFLLPFHKFINGQAVSVFDNPPGTLQEGIAIFESERLTFLTNKGQHFSAKMPCQVSAVWSVPNGVLLERKPSELDGGRCPLFSMFTVTHPLDEISPVIMKIPGPNNTFKVSFVSDTSQRILFVSHDPLLIVTRDTTTQLHSIWKFKSAHPSEYNNLYTLATDGQANVAPHALSHNTSTATLGPLSAPGWTTAPSVAPERCLSPFAASLSRLTTPKRAPRSSLSSGLPPPGKKVTFPANLVAGESGNTFMKDPALGWRLSSPFNADGIGLLSGPGSAHRPTTGDNTAYFPGMSHLLDSHVLPDPLCGDQEPLEEPLLPQACLELVWREQGGPTETRSTLHSSTPMQPRNGPIRDFPHTLGTSAVMSEALFHTPGNPASAPPLPSRQSKGKREEDRGFVAEDFGGTRWICFLVSEQCRLVLIRFEKAHQKLVFGATSQVEARDAVYLSSNKLILVVEAALGAPIALYSGNKKVSSLKISPCPLSSNFLNTSPAPSEAVDSLDQSRGPTALISTCKKTGYVRTSSCGSALIRFKDKVNVLSPVGLSMTSSFPSRRSSRHFAVLPEDDLKLPDSLKYTDYQRLKEATDNAVTVQTNNSQLLRVYLPKMTDNRIVNRCLWALQKTLPRDLGVQLLTRWYTVRNSPGRVDSSTAEWNQFTQFLLSMAGFQATSDPPDQPITEDKPPAHLEESLSSLPGFISTEASTSLPHSTLTPPAKRQKPDCTGSDADWTFLLANVVSSSDIPGLSSQPIGCPKTLRANSIANPFFKYFPSVLLSLHLVYENEKLNKVSWSQILSLGSLNFSIAQSLGLTKYAEYYCRDFTSIPQLAQVIPQIDPQKVSWPPYMDPCPPDLNLWITRFLLAPSSPPPYPYLPRVNDLSVQVITAMLVMGHSDQRHTSRTTGPQMNTTKTESQPHTVQLPSAEKFIRHICPSGHASVTALPPVPIECLSSPNLFHRLVLYLSHVGITSDLLDRFPSGLSFIFRCALAECRSNPPPNCSPVVYSLIGREDMSRHLSLLPTSTPPHSSETSSQPSMVVQPLRQSTSDTRATTHWEAKHHLLTLLEDHPHVQLAFKNDLRIREGYRLLQSSSKIKLTPSNRPGATETETKEDLESQLVAACVRTMALPVGRGMLGAGILETNHVTCMPARLVVPKLCLNGWWCGGGKARLLDITKIDTPPNMRLWPDFHNGVAAGLTVSPNANIDATWIMYNCKTKTADDLTSERAGVLFALGLQGHLNKLTQYNIRDHMSKLHDITNMSILLGLCASKRGTMDETLTRTVAVHLRRLLPSCSSSVDLEVPSLSEAGAMMGVGLLYQGSAHTRMAHLLLTEIGKAPGSDLEANMKREMLALTAGSALGLIMLKQCESTFSAADLAMAEQLHSYMVGGHKTSDGREEAGWGSGGSRSNSGSANRSGSGNNSFLTGGTSANPQIREGDRYNVDVTAPGATIALGLMFLGSGNSCVADWLKVADSQYPLDQVRPDLLLLRVVSLGLVMWHQIEPTEEWIAGHMPQTLHKFAFKRQFFSAKENQDSDNDFSDSVDQIDFDTMSLSCLNIMSGCCFVIGLRFAGTGSFEAATTLRKVLGMMLEGCANIGPSSVDSVGKRQMEQSVGIVLLSLSMVMAGSGNLEVIQIVRRLRARIGPTTMFSVNYGCHMMYAMATGLVFLGGGRLTLSNSPEAAAILFISLFPRFPSFSSDNRYHLQALRHLYILATVPRRICPVDVDTNRVVPSNMMALIKESQKRFWTQDTFTIPTDTLDKLEYIEINHDSPTYWPHRFYPDTKDWEIIKHSLHHGGYLYVKKKENHQDLIDDEWMAYHTIRWMDGLHISQLKLVVSFIKKTGPTHLLHKAQQLDSAITSKFWQHRAELKSQLNAYFTRSDHMIHPLFAAYLVWFSLPSRETLTPNFFPSDCPPVLQFIQSLKKDPLRLPVESSYWLHKLFYASPV